MVNYAVGALIREGKTHQLATQIQTGRDDGMITFEASLFELLRAGRITPRHRPGGRPRLRPSCSAASARLACKRVSEKY